MNGSNKEMHVPVANYTQNLITIAEGFRTVTPSSKILLITPPPIGDAARQKFAAERNNTKRGLLDRSNEMARKYAAACVDAANKAGVSVWDLYSYFDAMDVGARDTLLTDGIHFNMAGHQMLDENLRALIASDFPDVNDLLDTYQFPLVSRWVTEDPYVPESTN